MQGNLYYTKDRNESERKEKQEKGKNITDTIKIKDVYDYQQRSERQKKGKNETKDIITGKKQTNSRGNRSK